MGDDDKSVLKFGRKFWSSRSESIEHMRSSSWCCISCGMPFLSVEESVDFDAGRGTKEVRTFESIARVMRLGARSSTLPFTQWTHTRSKLFDDMLYTEGMAYGDSGGIMGEIQVQEVKKHMSVKTAKEGSWDKVRRNFVEKEFSLCQGCSLLARTTIHDTYFEKPENAAEPESEEDRKERIKHRKDHRAESLTLMKKCLSSENSSEGIGRVACFHISQNHYRMKNPSYMKDESMSWRLECLGRLIIGYTIHTYALGYSRNKGGAFFGIDGGTAADDVFSGLNVLNFETWYMYVFHPLIEYEAIMGMSTLADASELTRDPAKRTDNGAARETFGKIAKIVETYPFLISGKINIPTTSILGRAAARPPPKTGTDAVIDSPVSNGYFEFARTALMVATATDPLILPAPLCIETGFPGYLLLERLRIATKGHFSRTWKRTADLFNDYLNGSIYDNWIARSEPSSYRKRGDAGEGYDDRNGGGGRGGRRRFRMMMIGD